MPFHLEEELDRLQELVVKLESLLGEGAKGLARTVESGRRCEELAQRAHATLARIPPPKPAPPKFRQTIQVDEPRLVKVNLWLARWQRTLVDVDGRFPVYAKRTVEVVLDDPRMPGSPPIDVEQLIPVQQVMQVPLPPDTEDEFDSGEDPEPMPMGSFTRPRTFRYRLVATKERRRIHVDAVPPDAPLTPEQEVYVQRKKEIERDVRDITDYLRTVGAEIADDVSQSQSLRRAVDDLSRSISRLPTLDAAAASLEEMAGKVRTLVENVTTTRSQIEAEREAFRKTAAEIRTLLETS